MTGPHTKPLMVLTKLVNASMFSLLNKTNESAASLHFRKAGILPAPARRFLAPAIRFCGSNKDKYNKISTSQSGCILRKDSLQTARSPRKTEKHFFAAFLKKSTQNCFSYIILHCFSEKNKFFLYHFVSGNISFFHKNQHFIQLSANLSF